MAARWQKLKAGDRVRLLRVPTSDLEQREREIEKGLEDAGWTADALERILKLDPGVTIDHIDEYGAPWFIYKFASSEGEVDEHWINIQDDDSWEMA